MKIGIVIEKPSSSAVREGRMLSSFEQNFIAEKSRRCGLLPNQVQMMTADALIADLDGYVLMGELPLNLITNKKGIDKWHLSPVDGPDGFHRCVPTYDFRRLWADWPLTLYFEMSLRRIVQNASVERWVRKEERYALITDIDEGIARLEALLQLEPEWYSIDIETGRNQINTFGVSWTGNE